MNAANALNTALLPPGARAASISVSLSRTPSTRWTSCGSARFAAHLRDHADPQSAPHVRGVMNLRGARHASHRLRAALNLDPAEYGKFTVIIVLSVHGRTVGFIVDSVSDVLSLDAAAIERSPDLGGRVDASLVEGIARTARTDSSSCSTSIA